MPDYGDVGGSVMMCINTQVKRGVLRQGLTRTCSSWAILRIDKLISSILLSATIALFRDKDLLIS